MRILKHLFEQPFVAATGAAALIHSTWSLGTLFAGEQPEGLALWGWIIPALLIAFALDVGQIATSADIRRHGLTWRRGITFVVFAAATYYLQWLYIAHHMPALPIAAGVSAAAQGTAISLRDAALWIVPALLPLSTLLYTLSGGAKDAPEVVTVQKSGENQMDAPTAPAFAESAPLLALDASIKPVTVAHLPEVPPDEPHYRDKWIDPKFWLDDEDLDEDFLADKPQEHVATCKACGWHKSYESERRAQNALNAHARHCPRAVSVSSNGSGHDVTSAT